MRVGAIAAMLIDQVVSKSLNAIEVRHDWRNIHTSLIHQVLNLSPRQHNAGEIAGQRNADSSERPTEKGHFAEHDITAKHCQPYCEKEGRSEEDLSVC
jgi:hypothetical protein